MANALRPAHDVQECQSLVSYENSHGAHWKDMRLLSDLKNARTVHAIQEIWHQASKSFNPFHFNTALSALVKIARFHEDQRPDCRELAEKLGSAFVRSGRIGECFVSSIAICASAAADLHLQSNDLFSALARQLLAEMARDASFTARDLNMVLNAFLPQDETYKKLFENLQARLMKDKQMLSMCRGRDFALIAQVFSRCTFPTKDLFQYINTVLSQDQAIIQRFTKRECGILLDTFSKQNMCCDALREYYNHPQEEKEWASGSSTQFSLSRQFTDNLKQAHTVKEIESLWKSFHKPLKPFHYNAAISSLSRIAKYHPYPLARCRDIGAMLLKDLLRSGLIKDYKVKSVAILIAASAYLQIETKELLVALANQAIACREHLHELPPRSISLMANIFSKNGIPAKEFYTLIKDLLGKDEQLLQSCNAQDLAMIMNVLSQEKVLPGELFGKIGTMLEHKEEAWLASCNGQDFAMITNVLSKHGVRAEKLFAQINDLLLKNKALLEHCNCQDIGLLVNAFSKQNVACGMLFAHINTLLLEHNAKLLGGSSFQSLALITCAFSKLNIAAPALFQKVHSMLLDPARLVNSNSQDIAMIANAFVKFDVPPLDLLQLLVTKLLENDALVLASASTQHLAIIAAVYSKCTLPVAALFQRIRAQLVKDNFRLLAVSTGQELAMFANAFSKLELPFPDLFAKMLELLIQDSARRLVECTCQEHAMIVNAFSKQDLPLSELFEYITQCLLKDEARLLGDGSAQDIAMIANGFSKQIVPVTEFFSQMADVLQQGTTDERLVKAARACSKVEASRAELFRRMSLLLLKNNAGLLESSNDQSLAMIVNAYSKMGAEFGELFACACRTLLRNARLLASLNGQGVAMTVNAFSKQEVSYPDLFAHIHSRLLQDDKLLATMSTQACALILNGFAKQNVPVEALFLRIYKKLLEQDAFMIQHASIQDLAMIAEAFSRRGFLAPEFFVRTLAALKQVNADGIRLADTCNSQDVEMLSKALLKANVPAAELKELFSASQARLEKKWEFLLSKLLEDHARLLARCNGEQLALIVNAAILGNGSPPVPVHEKAMSLILRRIAEMDLQNPHLFEKFSSHDLVSLLWCFTVTNLAEYKVFFLHLIEKIVPLLEKDHAILPEDVILLKQIQLATRCQRSVMWSDVYAERLARFLDTKKEILAHPPVPAPSAAQKEIFKLLQFLYSGCEIQPAIEGQVVDCYLPKEHIVVLVHGPDHYSTQDKKTILHFLPYFKAFLLRSMGYSVAEIPYFEWNALKDDDKLLALNRGIQAMKKIRLQST